MIPIDKIAHFSSLSRITGDDGSAGWRLSGTVHRADAPLAEGRWQAFHVDVPDSAFDHAPTPAEVQAWAAERLAGHVEGMHGVGKYAAMKGHPAASLEGFYRDLGFDYDAEAIGQWIAARLKADGDAPAADA